MDRSRNRPASSTPRLHTGTPDTAGHNLAYIGFNTAGDIRVPLPVLAGADTECWRTKAPVTHGEVAGIAYTATDSACFGHLCRLDADPADAAEHAYNQLLDLQQSLDFPHLVRVWHFLHGINEGAGDDERYKRFCIGRARALDAYPSGIGRLPAATMVGSDQPGLHMHFLLARQQPTPVENPRQISAYHYPRQYGRRRPAFARAARLDWPEGDRQLFISGTASIVGHTTRHAGDAAAQLEETLTNIETVLAHTGTPFTHTGLGDLAQLKLYLRHPADLPAVQRVLDRRTGNTPRLCLRADLCRRDLLVEAEALAML